MRLKQWQPWHGIFTHIVSPHLRRVGLATPRVSPLFPDGGSFSRRAFIQGAAGAAGLALAAAHWTPAQAAKPSPGEPLPIPNVKQTPFGPVHAADPDKGQDPSLITDFSGVAGSALLSLTGVGTDTTTAQTARYDFNIDVRFMQGEFIGADGQHHQGTFAFIWLDSLADASPLGPHAYDPGTSPTGVFWTTPIPKHSVKIDLENGTGSLHLTNMTVFDFFTVPNSIDPVHLTPPVTGVAAATINSLDVEWSGMIKSQENNDPASTFAGTFLVTSATIDVVVTTAAVPEHGIHGFRFTSDATTASVFAEIGQEQNGAFYPGG